MFPDQLQRDEDDARDYLLALVEGVVAEVRAGLPEPEATDLRERAEKLARDLSAAPLRTFGAWQKAVHAYEAVASAVANARNARSRVARSYESMDDLRRDALAQMAGTSPYTVWDTRDHGRRRQLEAELASCHGAESALLVNSGASALAVAVGAMRLSPGATILMGRRGCSQSCDFLTRFVAPTGVKLVRVPPGNAAALLSALRALRPEVAFFETAVVEPGGDVPAGAPRWLAASPGTTFVVDNTSRSALTRWFRSELGLGKRLVVLESVTTFLSHHCAAGLLYGPASLVERLRDYARATGQKLQEKAFNFLRPAEIEHLGWKLARHCRNAGAFAEELSGKEGVEVGMPGGAADLEARDLLFDRGPGGVLFVRLSASRATESAHADLLAAWQTEARRRGAWVPVRAGFGWKDTTATVQASPREGRAAAVPYLRVSVGIEPEHVARGLAQALAAACSAEPPAASKRAS